MKLATGFLRMGLAFVFAYASFEIYLNPHNFLKYTPAFLLKLLPQDVFLYSFGIMEIVLAIWILTKWKSSLSSLVSLLLLLGIILFNLEHFSILFRNVAIATSALALFILDKQTNLAFKMQIT